ncbi:hypothetical protein IWQ61_004281 [Dispira simplex]|nr:hypothetical protein IWQ61_004281 [Dispira simplex]
MERPRKFIPPGRITTVLEVDHQLSLVASDIKALCRQRDALLGEGRLTEHVRDNLATHLRSIEQRQSKLRNRKLELIMQNALALESHNQHFGQNVAPSTSPSPSSHLPPSPYDSAVLRDNHYYHYPSGPTCQQATGNGLVQTMNPIDPAALPTTPLHPIVATKRPRSPDRSGEPHTVVSANKQSRCTPSSPILVSNVDTTEPTVSTSQDLGSQNSINIIDDDDDVVVIMDNPAPPSRPRHGYSTPEHIRPSRPIHATDLYDAQLRNLRVLLDRMPNHWSPQAKMHHVTQQLQQMGTPLGQGYPPTMGSMASLPSSPTPSRNYTTPSPWLSPPVSTPAETIDLTQTPDEPRVVSPWSVLGSPVRRPVPSSISPWGSPRSVGTYDRYMQHYGGTALQSGRTLAIRGAAQAAALSSTMVPPVFGDSYLPLPSQRTSEDVQHLVNSVQFDASLAQNQVEIPSDLEVDLLEHQKKGLSWMVNMEESRLRGGILADDMGLGKTIQSIALMLARPPKPDSCPPASSMPDVTNETTDSFIHDNPCASSSQSSTIRHYQTTLIVAPLSLLYQWKRELEIKASPGRFKIYVYHGPSRERRPEILTQYDVVITTYNLIASESAKSEPYPTDSGPLFLIKYWRVILDEAQVIKNKSTRVSIAVSQLESHYRWCLSGTPIQNSLDDLYAPIRFLKVRPYCVWERFRQDISGPAHGSNPQVQVFQRIQALIKAVLLRRMKTDIIDGKPILTLPEKTVHQVNVEFSQAEQEFYQGIEGRSQSAFEDLVRSNSVYKNYTSVLVMILRLRQACCHPHLVNDPQHRDLMSTYDDMIQHEEGYDDHILDVSEFYHADDTFSSTKAAKLKSESEGADTSANGALSPAPTAAGVPLRTWKSPPSWPSARKTAWDKLPMDVKGLLDRVDPATVQCFLCQDIAMEPVVMSPCGDMFCRDCIETVCNSILDDSKPVCPRCQDFIHPAQMVPLHYLPLQGAAYLDTLAPALKLESDSTDLSSGMGIPSSTNGTKKTSGQRLSGKLKGKTTSKSSSPSDTPRLKFVPSAKIRRMIDIVREIQIASPGEKIVVFSQFRQMLLLVSKALTHEKHGHVIFDGSISSLGREEMIQKFYQDPNIVVLLMSIKCGSVGLNLCCANHVILLDLWWNPALEDQATDRVHRIGQKKPVVVYRITIPNSVEDRILVLQEQKRDIIQRAFGKGDNERMGRLSMQDMTFLFQGS